MGGRPLKFLLDTSDPICIGGIGHEKVNITYHNFGLMWSKRDH